MFWHNDVDPWAAPRGPSSNQQSNKQITNKPPTVPLVAILDAVATTRWGRVRPASGSTSNWRSSVGDVVDVVAVAQLPCRWRRRRRWRLVTSRAATFATFDCHRIDRWLGNVITILSKILSRILCLGSWEWMAMWPCWRNFKSDFSLDIWPSQFDSLKSLI